MLTRKIMSFAALWLAIVVSGQAQSNDKGASISLFSLGKKEIPAAEFLYLYRKNHPPEKKEEYTREKVGEYLDLFIKFKLKVEEARTRKMDTASSFQKEFNGYREELRKPYMPDNNLVDSLVRLTYERLKEEVRVMHLLVNLKPDASPADTLQAYEKIMELRSRILNGADFREVAAAYSEDPTARLNKGDLGYFTALQMVFPFENAAYETNVGDVSMPVRTRFGYHLLKVQDRRPSSGEVEVSHIMLRTGDGHDNDKARNTAFDIYDKLLKGVKWEELCREYSEDQASKDNGGRLRPFGIRAMASVPEFEQMAFNLQKPGDISDPFKTQYGWHIMRLEGKAPLPPFETLSASLRNRVARDERVQLSRQLMQEKMRKDFEFREDKLLRDKLFAKADSALVLGKWEYEPPTDAGTELFSLKNKSFTVADFLVYAARHQKAVAMTPAQYAAQLYNDFVDGSIGLMLEEKIKAENPDYAWLLNEYYEGILLFEIMEQEVWNKATEDSAGQRRYYDAHKGDYKATERIRATIFSTNNEAHRNELKDIVASGDSSKVQSFAVSKKIRQEQGAFERSDRPVLSKVEWRPGMFTAENNGQYYVILTTEMLPPGNKTFDEARAAVISDYQNFLEQQWIEVLKKKYPVKVNRRAKQYIEKELIKP